MKLVSFPEQNIVFGEKQPQYLPLPAHVVRDDPDGRVTCCWKLSWRERFAVLFRGVVWHQVLTFRQALQPQKLTVDNPF